MKVVFVYIDIARKHVVVSTCYNLSWTFEKKSLLLLSQLVVKPSQYVFDVFLSGFFVFVFSPLCCVHALSCLSQLLNCPAILMANYSQ